MSHKLRMFVSQEDLAQSTTPENEDGGLVIDETHEAGDNPVIELHGVTSDDSVVTALRDSVDDPNALMVSDPTAQQSLESQQLDEAAIAEDESRASSLAELGDEANALIHHHVFILHGNDPVDDLDDGLTTTFSALAKSAIEDPTHTVAAFLPIDAPAGEPQARSASNYAEENMQRMLREQGVPYVSSIEALAEHLNFVLSGHLVPGVSLEAASSALKSGQRVRYSHGHGKIQKVITAPTKINGKLHHATKSAPLYVVKSEKGGKVTLHKASALTPV